MLILVFGLTQCTTMPTPDDNGNANASGSGNENANTNDNANGDGNTNGNTNGNVNENTNGTVDATNGTLSGTVTNLATGTPFSDLAVTLEPAIEGVEIATDENGAFSLELPVGVYTLTIEQEGFETSTRTVAVNSLGVTELEITLSPAQAVLVRASMEGDAVPGGDVTVTVAVEVLDGQTTVESYSWSQSNSVAVSITNADTATATVSLPDVDAFKAELLGVIAEPPITQDQLPENVPLPEGEFPAGLQERFQILGLNPLVLEEAALVTLSVEVETSSGIFSEEIEIHTQLPWSVTSGIHNVPIDVSVLLQGKTQDTYDWALSRPTGSSAAFTDAASQNPYFTPDQSGMYTITVTDGTLETPETVSIVLYAGT